MAEALLALAVARAAMALLPFRRIASWLGTPGAETPATASADQIHAAQEIGWAVGTLARRIPWDGRCLAQALAASAMLRRRGLEGTVSFGARASGSTQTSDTPVSPAFEAHAWLRVGDCIVTGGAAHHSFKTFTTFARRQP